MWSTPLDQVLRIRLVDMVAHSWVQQAPLSKDQVRPPLPALPLPSPLLHATSSHSPPG